MNKTDEKMISYLTPSNDNQMLKYGSDTYFCGCSKYLKTEYKYSCIDKVKNWVERNGGRFEIKSDFIVLGDKTGKFVRIVFPCYNKRNMKEIMQKLFI